MSTADSSSLTPVPRSSPSTSCSSSSWLLPWPLVKDLGVPAAVLTAGLTLLCQPVLSDLWNLWMSREDYAHGFLIPLISLYVVRAKAPALAACPIEPRPIVGAILMLSSLVGVCAGIAGGVITLSSVSCIGLLGGLVVLLCGVPSLRILAFPLGFLVFMTPLLDVVVEPLQRPLQLATAWVVSGLFRAAGVPTFLDGTVIQFPNGVLQVSVECSGAGFLISTLAIGLPLAALSLHTWPRRLALLLAALMMSAAANWARVTLIAVLGYRGGWGPQVHGPFHILQGMLVYWVGFGALFLGAWLLARGQPGPRSANDRAVPAWPPARPTRSAWRRHWWLAAALSVAATVFLQISDRGPVEASRSYALFPRTIGSWVAEEADETPPPLRVQGADEVVDRIYRNAEGVRLRLYIAYVAAQLHGRELVNYATAPLHQHTRPAALTIGPERLPVNLGFWEQQDRRLPLLFWYALEGRQIGDRREAKLVTMLHALTRRGSQGALVLIMKANGEAGQADGAADDLMEFATELVAVLPPYMP